MSLSKISIKYQILVLVIGCLHSAADADDGSNLHTEPLLQLSAEQQQLAGIQVTPAAGGFSPQSAANAVLQVDRERTFTLTPQLDVIVLQRHVVPGQQVIAGQRLLTLGGVDVAKAQADFINAASNWRRINAMSATAISDSERQQALVAKEQCRAVLQALQMTAGQIAALQADPTLIGSYQLLAPINGRVQQDNTRLGELQSAGNVLLQLTDESSLWVVAEMTPQQSAQLAQAKKLLVKVDATMVSATIIGRAHELSSSTRTERLIAQLDNRQTYWHAGQFAEVFLPQPEQPGVLLPDAALSRSEDGDWQVFVATAAGFRAQEVQVRQQQRGMNLVTGIAPGTPVVTAGAFFLASELAKSGFDVHNH